MKQLAGTIGRHIDATDQIMLWNVYFLIKICLYAIDAINLNVGTNLLLFLAILLPLPRRGWWRSCRTTALAVAAVLVLWHESWLPSPGDTYRLLADHGLPSVAYMGSFMKGAVSMSVVCSFGVVVVVSYLLRSFKRVSIVAMAAVITVSPLLKGFGDPARPGGVIQVEEAEAAEKDPAKYLESFYARESERMIVFKQPQAGSVPFDVVVLHLCSLSWDDLEQIGMSPESPFFREFDYLFTNFNSATGYSGPAVMRLLQANGGQRSHGDVHGSATPKEYFLFESLASLGYERYIAMDHDGKYGNYNSALKKNGLNGARLINHDSLSSAAVFFDGKTPLYSDQAMFRKWLDVRNGSKAERAALYFNSVLMHAGTHWVGEKKWAGRDPRDQYKDVASVVQKDIVRMIDLLKASKRNTVLVLVSEHGRALTGSPFQPPDMRDVPLPKITKVPMAVKLIGPKFNGARVNQTVVSKPTSYFAISWLLARFMERSPFGPTAETPQELAGRIPRTDFVAENDSGKVVEIAGVYHYLGKTKRWVQLTPAQLK
ncbi:cellulose biosynthesis protein BcsG [Trichlorobacter ammonificans]|uniref:Cellulose biosynthesis protein BcsG n=1 Tax=Trichlorobacter ammonificans TaxID=2916410 RepID=A0ABN8HFI5_9BACT|nr:cellulose biosynthesis protein BcsG [Trichlorobacter ammonificans]CAH2029854.1 putative Cellulose biosynthesis protein BcsG [Trichlorobacter ammonificans]